MAGRGIEMEQAEPNGDGLYLFRGAIPCGSSGQHGFSVRVVPKHEDVNNPFVMNLVTWV